jgi:hypothetical protein
VAPFAVELRCKQGVGFVDVGSEEQRVLFGQLQGYAVPERVDVLRRFAERPDYESKDLTISRIQFDTCKSRFFF